VGGAVSDLCVCGERDGEGDTDQVRCPGWGAERPGAWYMAGEGAEGGKRLEWRIGTGIYTLGDDDRAEIG
jgi:hypothetical protein